MASLVRVENNTEADKVSLGLVGRAVAVLPRHVRIALSISVSIGALTIIGAAPKRTGRIGSELRAALVLGLSLSLGLSLRRGCGSGRACGGRLRGLEQMAKSGEAMGCVGTGRVGHLGGHLAWGGKSALVSMGRREEGAVGASARGRARTAFVVGAEEDARGAGWGGVGVGAA